MTESKWFADSLPVDITADNAQQAEQIRGLATAELMFIDSYSRLVERAAERVRFELRKRSRQEAA